MKNKIVFYSLLLALFTYDTKLVAQFDDVYYDPELFELEEETIVNSETEQRFASNESIVHDEWDDDDYEYSSRIRRFHRPYRHFDYYDPCYVDVYYYDPFAYDPWFWDRDIYYSHNRYNDYYRWRRWNGVYRPYRYTYWNNWDWSYGYGGQCSGYNYGYNPYYYGYNYSNYYHNNSHWGGWNSRNDNNDWNNNSNRGSYYGSRKHGLVVTSKNGPSRIHKPHIPPKIIAANGVKTSNGAPKVENKPNTGNTPRRVVETPGEKSNQNPNQVLRPSREVRVESPRDGLNEGIPSTKPDKTRTSSPVITRKEETDRVRPDFKPNKRIERVETDSRPKIGNNRNLDTDIPENKPRIIRKENSNEKIRTIDDPPREIKKMDRSDSPREYNEPRKEIKSYEPPRNSSNNPSNSSRNESKSNDSGSGRKSPR